MKKIMAMAAMSAASIIALPAAANAQEGDHHTLQAELTPQNDSGASATATVKVNGTEMHVKIEGSGFTPGEAPHAQHIHGVLGENAVCPSMADDANGDGFLTTSEGQPKYGPILVSLTTEGAMTPDDALAVDRMPLADANGNLTYERTFEVDAEIAENIDELHIVQHGVDFNDSGAYDGDRMSELDPSLPAEATDPADCGQINAMPAGGVQTGGGATAPMQDSTTQTGVLALIGLAAASVVAGTGFALKRSAS